VAVRDDVTGRGLGTLLVRRLIDHARRRGVGELFGQVLRENARMLGICRRLGLREEFDPETPWVTVVRLAL
jgi:acetyltransferase